MVKIKLYEHPLAVVEPKIFKAESVAEWLLEHYGEAPSINVQVYKGEPCTENEVSSDVKELVYGREEYYTVLQSPGEPVSLTAFLVQVAITVAISFAMSILFPPPDMPGNVNRTQSSPNNSLANRENQVRLNQRVEDIYGTVKSIPSLMMQTYYKYVSHKQYEYGYYCVGRGYYDISNIKDDKTLLSSISGARASVYAPFTSPNSGTPQLTVGAEITENIYSISRPSDVDGITLKALNQVQLPTSTEYTFNNEGSITQSVKEPNFNSILTAGDSIEVMMGDYVASASGIIAVQETNTFVETETIVLTGEYLGIFNDFAVGDVITTSGFTNSANNSTFTVVSITPAIGVVSGDSTTYFPGSITVDSTSLVDETTEADIISAPINRSGLYDISAVEDGKIYLEGVTWTRPLTVSCNIQVIEVTADSNYATQYTDWVTLPDPNRTQVWCNILATAGMYRDAGEGKVATSVTFDIEIEQLDSSFVPTGLVQVVNGYLEGAVSDERAITIEHTTSWVGPARVRAKRTSAYEYGFQGTIVDEIKWNDLYSVTPIDKLHFGNKTTIHTVTKATARATSASSRKLNCIASRKLPIYNGSSFSGAFDSTGLLVSGTISATSRLVDILAAICTDPKIGGGVSQLDLSQVYLTQAQLNDWSEEAGQFNYTFDSDSSSFEEMVTIVANAGFCLPYRQNGKIRLAFDRLQPSSTALFTHRNKKPNSETISRSFATDAEYDGVEFVYQDPVTEQTETISLPLDGSATKYKKFEIPGIRSYPQAWYRANREYQRLKGQRMSIETDCTTDARLLLPNTRVDIVDNTRFKAYDGEVVKQEGLVLTLSREVVFEPSGVHSILLMKRDGSLQSIVCTAGSSANQVVLQSLPEEALVTSYGVNGIRTIFSFASDSSRLAQAWLVQEVGLSDNQYIKIKAINYSPAYYYYDTQAIPAKDSVIN